MEGWGHMWSRARRDVIPSQMLPKRFWHVLWVDHLLSKHTGSVLTQSEGVREDWWMTSSWLEFGILQTVVLRIDFSFSAENGQLWSLCYTGQRWWCDWRPIACFSVKPSASFLMPCHDTWWSTPHSCRGTVNEKDTLQLLLLELGINPHCKIQGLQHIQIRGKSSKSFRGNKRSVVPTIHYKQSQHKCLSVRCVAESVSMLQSLIQHF